MHDVSTGILDPLIEAHLIRQAAEGDEALGGEAPPARPDRKRVNRFRRKRIRRRFRSVLIILMIPVLISYVGALTGPGADSFQARTVEWARDHHLGGVVDRVERSWYAGHQAPVGGVPSAAARARVAQVSTPVIGSAVTAPSLAPTPPAGVAVGASPTTPTQTLGTSPPALQSPASSPLADEGVWSPLLSTPSGKVGAYLTMIRPDNVHTSSLDAVIRFDASVYSFRHYPGAKIPGAPWDRPDYVEPERQSVLVAAFAGGFRLRDSNGGMLLGGHELRAMREGGATFSIDANGVANVGMWGRDIYATDRLDSARQNLDLIVDAGTPIADLANDPNRKWGFTGPANKSAVWRSGAGVTSDGALIWVGGPGLTIQALAETLVRAGAVRGMQLEINQEWVQFNSYAPNATGAVSGTKLLDGMQHTGDRWLSEDTRDFVAVFRRPAA